MLKRVVTGNRGESRTTMYSENDRGRSNQKLKKQSQSQNEWIRRWWDSKGIIHYVLLHRDQTIDSDLYYQQLTRLSEAIKKKRSVLTKSRVIFFRQNNARFTSLLPDKSWRSLARTFWPSHRIASTLNRQIIIHPGLFKTLYRERNSI